MAIRSRARTQRSVAPFCPWGTHPRLFVQPEAVVEAQQSQRASGIWGLASDPLRGYATEVAQLERKETRSMHANPLKTLGTFGQSLWLDYIRRDLITSGQLRRLIEEDGLRGMTSNPSIFEKAIVDSQEYDEDIRTMALEGKGVNAIYETLSQRDVQSAADEFRSVYDKTDGHDGYVSLEVNPHLAHDTKGTVEEAHRLWKALARPNVFIKVPATTEGLSAIQELISEGINVNVTLLFGLPRYRHVAEAYLAGLAARAARGKPVKHVASVASFFVSRIDGWWIRCWRKSSCKAARRQTSRKRRAGTWRLPARKWPIKSTKRCSGVAGLRSWPFRGLVSSACSGPVPAPRTRTRAT